MSEGSLWGNLSDIQTIRTPKTILVEQANILTDATKGVVRAQVEASQTGSTLDYTLVLVAPVLNNYQYTVCRISHGVKVYPYRLFDNTTSGVKPPQQCANEDELKEKLGAILSSNTTRNIVQSLLSQSKT